MSCAYQVTARSTEKTISGGVPGDPPASVDRAKILLHPLLSSSHSPQLTVSQITTSMISLVMIEPATEVAERATTSYMSVADKSAFSLTAVLSPLASAPRSSVPYVESCAPSRIKILSNVLNEDGS